MMSSTFHRVRFTWLAYLMLAFFAYYLNILGPIAPFLKDELGLDYTVSSLHYTAFALGFLVVGLGGHLVIRRIGRGRALWMGAAGLSGGALLLVSGRSPFITIGAAFVMGLVGSLILTIIPSALSDQHGEQRAVALSEANVVSSLLSTAAPLLVGWLAAGAGNSRLPAVIAAPDLRANYAAPVYPPSSGHYPPRPCRTTAAQALLGLLGRAGPIRVAGILHDLVERRLPRERLKPGQSQRGPIGQPVPGSDDPRPVGNEPPGPAHPAPTPGIALYLAGWSRLSTLLDDLRCLGRPGRVVLDRPGDRRAVPPGPFAGNRRGRQRYRSGQRARHPGFRHCHPVPAAGARPPGRPGRHPSGLRGSGSAASGCVPGHLVYLLQPASSLISYSSQSDKTKGDDPTRG